MLNFKKLNPVQYWSAKRSFKTGGWLWANRGPLFFNCVVNVLVTILVAGCASVPKLSRSPEFKPQWKRYEDAPVVTEQPSDLKFQLRWPILYPSKVNRGFDSDKPHFGIDFSGRKNSPILAAAPGTIIYTGHKFHGYGNLVIIEHSDGVASLYAHLNRIKVKEGQFVNAGETVGLMGRTGHATGVHLHFEFRVNYSPIDPAPFFPKPGSEEIAKHH